MLRYLFIALISLTFPLSVSANTPHIEVEELNFDLTLAAAPNTQMQYNTEEGHDTNTMVDDHGLAHASHAEKKAGLPQFDITTFSSQIFWLAITFVLMYLAMAKMFLPRLSKVIDERDMRIKMDFDAADILTKDVTTIREAYEADLETAHTKARETVAKINEDLKEQALKDANAFKADADKQIALLEKSAKDAKDTIKDDIKDIAQSLTSEVVQTLSLLKLSDAIVEKAIDANIEGSSVSQKKKAA